MLTSTEKRFIKYWQEQRKGGRAQYYLLYIIMGTFIATIILSFLSAMFLVGFVENLPFVIIGSFLLVTIATVLSWANNEKRFKRIIQREIREGKQRDEAGYSI